MKKSISHKITVLTFAFTLVMVAYHAKTAFFSENETLMRVGVAINSLYDYLGCIAMAFFFTMTGYLFYRNITETEIKGKILRRVKTLLIPLTAWNVIYLVGFMVFDRDSVGGGKVLNIIYHFTFAPYDGPLWYLFAVFILTLFAPVVIFAKKHNTAKLFFQIVSIIAPVVLFSFDILKQCGLSEKTHFVMWLNRLFRYLPCYSIGSIVGMRRHDKVSTCNVNTLYRISLVVLMVVYGLIWMLNPNIHNLYKQFIIMTTPVIVWFVVNEDRFEKYNNTIVRNSFLIYATHFMVIFVFREVIKKFRPATGNLTSFITWMAEPIMCVILTYLCCALFDWLMKKAKLEKFENVLTGSRI